MAIRMEEEKKRRRRRGKLFSGSRATLAKNLEVQKEREQKVERGGEEGGTLQKEPDGLAQELEGQRRRE